MTAEGAGAPIGDARVREIGETPDGDPVHVYQLGSRDGVLVEVLTLGATVRAVEVAGADGVRRNVALGFDSVAAYLASTDYLGATVGRYANRIAGARFRLNGVEHRLEADPTGHQLHGGPHGYHRRLWAVEEASDSALTLSLHSPDGDQGFPGDLDVVARFAVEASEVSITYEATASRRTPVNLTNHAYFNLDGHEVGSIAGHTLQVNAAAYLPTDRAGIPVADSAPVAGTDLDLRHARLLAEVFQSSHSQLGMQAGIDHNYVLDGDGLRLAATLGSARAGLALDVLTDQPGLQVYTGNMFDAGRSPAIANPYPRYAGVALETQRFPDAPNTSWAAQAMLDPGTPYSSATVWRFRIV